MVHPGVGARVGRENHPCIQTQSHAIGHFNFSVKYEFLLFLCLS